MDIGASMTLIPPERPYISQDTKIKFWEALRQTWAALAVHSMVIMVGMTLGFSAILLPQLEEADSEIKISRSDASWLASVVSFVAPIGSLGSGPVVQWLGSKKTIALSLIPFAIGWLLISFANGLPMLLIGRIITGLSNTFGNAPCTVYITEVSSPVMRPMLTTTGPTISSLGVLMVYMLGWLFSWRIAALVPAAWSLICIAALTTIPESPVWLASHRRFDEARKAIYWFHNVKPLEQTRGKGILKSIVADEKADDGSDGIGHEYDDVDQRRQKAERAFTLLMKEQSKGSSACQSSDGRVKILFDEAKKQVTYHFPDEPERKKTGFMQHLVMLFIKPTGLRPLLILTTMFLIQQYAGVYITLFYAVNVFKEMGGGAMDEYVASILVGVVRFAMSVVNIWLFRRFGRRPLCLLSALGMAICMLTSGTSLYLTSIDAEVSSENAMVNHSLEYLKSTPTTIQSTPQYLGDVVSESTINLNLSLHEQQLPHAHRSVRSINESFEYSSTNNPIPGNTTKPQLVDCHFGWVDQTKAKQMGLLPRTQEKPFSPKFEDLKKNSSHVEVRITNKDNEKTDPSSSSSPPPASGHVKKSSVIPTICMLLYVCVSMIGLLAIPWTMTAELFPTEIRGLANSVVLSLANILLFSGLQLYPNMLDAFGPHGVLWMFAVVSAVGGVFVYFFLPETFGKNLAEIEEYFSENTVYTYPCKKV